MTWLDGLEQFLRWLIRPERRVEPKTERSEEAPGEPVAYGLALDEAIRALEGQRQSLDELRARAGILLSAALLIGALLGGPASQTNSPNYVTTASVLLVLAVAGSLLVLRPSGGWKFSVGTKALLKDYIESDSPATVPELHRSLAWHMDDDYMENQRRLKWLYRTFSIASVLVVGETIMWLVAILQPRTPRCHLASGQRRSPRRGCRRPRSGRVHRGQRTPTRSLRRGVLTTKCLRPGAASRRISRIRGPDVRATPALASVPDASRHTRPGARTAAHHVPGSTAAAVSTAAAAATATTPSNVSRRQLASGSREDRDLREHPRRFRERARAAFLESAEQRSQEVAGPDQRRNRAGPHAASRRPLIVAEDDRSLSFDPVPVDILGVEREPHPASR